MKLTEKQIATLDKNEHKAYVAGELAKLVHIFGAIKDLPETEEWYKPEHDQNRDTYLKIFSKAQWEASRKKDHIPERFLKKKQTAPIIGKLSMTSIESI